MTNYVEFSKEVNRPIEVEVESIEIEETTKEKKTYERICKKLGKLILYVVLMTALLSGIQFILNLKAFKWLMDLVSIDIGNFTVHIGLFIMVKLIIFAEAFTKTFVKNCFN